MNTSVSFNLAQLLKEKEVIIKPLSLKNKTDYIEGYELDTEDAEDFLKIRDFQFEDNVCSHLYLKPTIAEVVMWLYERHSIWVKVECPENSVNNDWVSYIHKIGKFECIFASHIVSSPTEAYEAAIHYCLKNLI
jgi:hypothetical protein